MREKGKGKTTLVLQLPRIIDHLTKIELNWVVQCGELRRRNKMVGKSSWKRRARAK